MIICTTVYFSNVKSAVYQRGLRVRTQPDSSLPVNFWPWPLTLYTWVILNCWVFWTLFFCHTVHWGCSCVRKPLYLLLHWDLYLPHLPVSCSSFSHLRHHLSQEVIPDSQVCVQWHSLASIVPPISHSSPSRSWYTLLMAHFLGWAGFHFKILFKSFQAATMNEPGLMIQVKPAC